MRLTSFLSALCLATLITVATPGESTRVVAQGERLRGFADLHVHQFADLAFGGQHVVGRAFGPLRNALAPAIDRHHHGDGHKSEQMGAAMATGTFEIFPRYFPNDG